VHYSLNSQFDRAERFWDSLKEKSNYSVEVRFYKLLNQQLKMLDLEDYSSAEQFDRDMNQFLKELKYEQSGIRKNFFAGSVYFYKSFLLSRMGKLLSAFQYAIRGRKLLEKCVREDSTFLEPYIALGAFKYWKSVKAGFLSKIGLIKDEREEGVRLLKIAVKNISGYSVILARDQLSWILINEKQPTEALILSKENMKMIPQSRFIKWTLMETYEALRNYERALQLAIELNHFYGQVVKHFPVNFLVTLQKIFTYFSRLSSNRGKYYDSIRKRILLYQAFKRNQKPGDKRTWTYIRSIDKKLPEVQSRLGP
jgi:tetratricopeptide (TPR) repeat protein